MARPLCANTTRPTADDDGSTVRNFVIRHQA
jgi:hypothetical protein